MSKTRPTATAPLSGPASVPEPGTNLVVLRGTLSREPQQRELPSGDALVGYEVTIRSGPGEAQRSRAESVPVTWFDPPAAATRLDVGDDVLVVGRVRRRFFRSGGSTASRTEVVAAAVVPVRAPARVRRALAPVVGVLVGDV